MKIFILAAQENWITDQLAKEWIQHNKDKYTTYIQDADVIWILSNYICDALPLEIYRKKKVITTIHHIVPWKMDETRINHYKKLDKITDIFHSICDKTTEELSKYTKKKIITIPFWNNQNLYFNINKKQFLREKYKIDSNCYLIGSFQRDTEGSSIESGSFLPKLEKGPDIFINAVKYYKSLYSNVKVLLTGRCRQYVMKELQKLGIIYIYFEMVDNKTLNELYNCLDLYIVGSRVEGGPRAINECALAKVPIISTDVGIANNILSEKSIFNEKKATNLMNVYPDEDYAYINAVKLNIPNYFKTFNKLFEFK